MLIIFKSLVRRRVPAQSERLVPVQHRKSIYVVPLVDATLKAFIADNAVGPIGTNMALEQVAVCGEGSCPQERLQEQRCVLGHKPIVGIQEDNESIAGMSEAM